MNGTAIIFRILAGLVGILGKVLAPVVIISMVLVVFSNPVLIVIFVLVVVGFPVAAHVEARSKR